MVGVDSSPDMLAVARRAVPDAEFREGDLLDLPLPDDDVDVAVCALALAHLPDLAPAMAELARVLRPGGHLVVSDMHPESVLRSSVPSVRDDEGRPGRLPAYRHLVGDYLRAALPAGLRVLRCEEPCPPAPPDTAPADGPGPWDVWPWSLAAMVPGAARAATTACPDSSCGTSATARIEDRSAAGHTPRWREPGATRHPAPPAVWIGSQTGTGRGAG